MRISSVCMSLRQYFCSMRYFLHVHVPYVAAYACPSMHMSLRVYIFPVSWVCHFMCMSLRVYILLCILRTHIFFVCKSFHAPYLCMLHHEHISSFVCLSCAWPIVCMSLPACPFMCMFLHVYVHFVHISSLCACSLMCSYLAPCVCPFVCIMLRLYIPSLCTPYRTSLFLNLKQACRFASATNGKNLRVLVRPPAGCQCVST